MINTSNTISIINVYINNKYQVCEKRTKDKKTYTSKISNSSKFHLLSP